MYCLTASATSRVEARAVFVTVKLTDGSPLKRPIVFASSKRRLTSATSDRVNCPPPVFPRNTSSPTASALGATPMPRNRISPSAACKEPPGKSCKFCVKAFCTSVSDTFLAAISCGSTITHNSHS